MNEFIIKLAIVQTVIFGLVLFFLKKILHKDTESSVSRLENSYEEVKKRKEELAKKIMEIENEYNLKKEEAARVAQEIKDAAQKEAYAVRDDAFKKAKLESEDIISKAHKTVDKVRQDIHTELEAKLIEFCAELLKRIFSQVARLEVHQVLVKEFIEELRKTDISRISMDADTVEIVSIVSLSKDDRSEIEEIITEKTKKKFTYSERVDENILGGVMVKFGSLNLDGSLASRLKDAVLLQKQKIDERV